MAITQRLYLHSPVTVLTATVAAGVAYPVHTIPVTGLSGAISLAKPGMTVVFGSEPGFTDRGRTYIRKDGTTGELYIGLSSRGRFTDGEVDLATGTHVTVWDDYRVWAKMQRMEVTGEFNEETQQFPMTLYKDGDLEAAGRANFPPPVANGGAGFAGTIDSDTGVLTVTFSAASYATAPGATLTGRTWDIADGTLSGGGALTDNTIQATFPPGFRWVHLTATDSNDKSHMQHIPVFARDPDNDLTIPAWQVESHRITRSGQILNIRIRSPIPFAAYPGGTLAMIWEGEPESPALRNHMVFIGWHANSAAEVTSMETAILRDITLELVDVAGRLATLAAFSQEITNTLTEPATTWLEMRQANVWNFLHYLLHWHSTALNLADWNIFYRPDEYAFVVLGAEGNNLFDQINNLARQIVPDCSLACDTKGRLHLTADVLLMPEDERPTGDPIMLQPEDWTDIQVRHTPIPPVRWLHGGAMIARDTPLVDGEGNEYPETIFCRAPGLTPGQGTGEVHNESQIALSQEQLNIVEGHRYAILNSLESHYTITLAGSSLRGIDPAFNRFVTLTIPPGYLLRGLSFTNSRGLVREIDIRYQYDDEGATRTVVLTWEREWLGVPALTVDVMGMPVTATDDFAMLGLGSGSLIATMDADGEWDIQNTGGDTSWQAAAYAPGLNRYVVTGGWNLNLDVSATSEDLVNWTVHTTPNSADTNGGFWPSVAWSESLALFAAVRGISGPAAGNRIMTSSDGMVWDFQVGPASLTFWESVAWADSLGLFIAVGNRSVSGDSFGMIMTSSDGITWDLQSDIPDNGFREGWWIPEWGLFLANNELSTPAVYTSSNGVDWTQRLLPPLSGFDYYSFFAYSPSLSLAIMFEYRTRAMIYTEDGISWTRVEDVIPAGIFLSSATWSPALGKFLIMDFTDDPRPIFESSDGFNWQALSTPVPVTNFQLGHLYGLPRTGGP